MARIDQNLVDDVVHSVRRATSDRVAEVFASCFADTLTTTIRDMGDGSAFMVTGDIPAMWLRDSTEQLRPYLHFADRDNALSDTIAAISRRQFEYVLLDPYANAFNAAADGAGHSSDETELSPWVWERKYEVDSLCGPLRLAHDLWRVTGRTDHLARFPEALRTIVDLWRTEQDHERDSRYRFQRPDAPVVTDTLTRNGKGPETVPSGLTWSGFRPSDDASTYGYNIPGNAYAVVALRLAAVLAREVTGDIVLAADAAALADVIDDGIRRHGVIGETPADAASSGKVDAALAYEVDGRGNALLMDDANVPSLLSLPFIGWCSSDDPLYVSTRRFILGEGNPYYFSGREAAGIGSPHTPDDHVWPIALAMQGLTSTDEVERERLLTLLCATDAGTDLMHESFHVDDPTTFTRPWFSWANAMFCEFVLDVCGLRDARLSSPMSRAAATR